MYKIFIPKEPDLLIFTNKKCKLWNYDNYIDLFQEWKGYTDLYALEWVNILNAKITLILKPNEFEKINYIGFMNSETGHVYYFWVNGIEFNDTYKQNITLFLTWDIFANKILQNSSITCKLKYTTLPELTYYYKDAIPIYNKTNILLKEGFSDLPKTKQEIITLGKIEPWTVNWLNSRKYSDDEDASKDVTYQSLYQSDVVLGTSPNSYWIAPSYGFGNEWFKSIVTNANTITTTYSIYNSFLGLLVAWWLKNPTTGKNNKVFQLMYESNTSLQWYDQWKYADDSYNAMNTKNYVAPIVSSENILKYMNKTIKWYDYRKLAGVWAGTNLVNNGTFEIMFYFIDGSCWYHACNSHSELRRYLTTTTSPTFQYDDIVRYFEIDKTTYHRNNIRSNKNERYYAPILYQWLAYVNGDGDIRSQAIFATRMKKYDLENFNTTKKGNLCLISPIINEYVMSNASRLWGKIYEYKIPLDIDNDIKLSYTSTHTHITFLNPYVSIELNGYELFLRDDLLSMLVREYLAISGTSYSLETYNKEYYNIYENKTSDYAFVRSSAYDSYMYSNSSQVNLAKNQAKFNLAMTAISGVVNTVSEVAKLPFAILGSGMNFAMGAGVISNALGGHTQTAIENGMELGMKKGALTGGQSIFNSLMNTVSGIVNADFALKQIDAQLNDMKNVYTSRYSNETQAAINNYRLYRNYYEPYWNQGTTWSRFKYNSIQNDILLIHSYSNDIKNVLNTFYKLYGWKNNEIYTITDKAKKNPKYDYIQVENIISEDIPAVYKDYIIREINNGIWLLNDPNLKTLEIPFKDNKIYERS